VKVDVEGPLLGPLALRVEGARHRAGVQVTSQDQVVPGRDEGGPGRHRDRLADPQEAVGVDRLGQDRAQRCRLQRLLDVVDNNQGGPFNQEREQALAFLCRMLGLSHHPRCATGQDVAHQGREQGLAATRLRRGDRVEGSGPAGVPDQNGDDPGQGDAEAGLVDERESCQQLGELLEGGLSLLEGRRHRENSIPPGSNRMPVAWS
jgi:hypothetical protein